MRVVRDLQVLLRSEGFRRLFAVRLVSQCGDGMFQAGLATLFFFSPEKMATAGDVAAAFAVMLLPFTIVGPFAGPLLDRWRRRQVLLLGNLVRVGLGVTLAVLMVTVGVGPAVYVVALVTLGVNRFLLSALSAGLPRVVERDQLLVANSITPTLGAVSAVVGGALGFVVGMVVAAGPVKDGLVLVLAASLFGAASALALRLGKDQLGPTRQDLAQTSAGLWADVRSTTADLASGAHYLLARRTPATALGVMALHRFLYGANFIALILISRNLLSDPLDSAAGLATFATLTGISLAGSGTAIVLTPLAHARMSPVAWITLCLGLGVLSQVLMLLEPTMLGVALAAAVLGLSVQGSKIAVDTIVQRDTADEFRGRAFALYDVLYNAAFVGAAALAAVALPDTGWSRATFAGLAVVYAVTGLALARTRREPVEIPVAAVA